MRSPRSSGADQPGRSFDPCRSYLHCSKRPDDPAVFIIAGTRVPEPERAAKTLHRRNYSCAAYSMRQISVRCAFLRSDDALRFHAAGSGKYNHEGGPTRQNEITGAQGPHRRTTLTQNFHFTTIKQAQGDKMDYETTLARYRPQVLSILRIMVGLLFLSHGLQNGSLSRWRTPHLPTFNCSRCSGSPD